LIMMSFTMGQHLETARDICRAEDAFALSECRWTSPNKNPKPCCDYRDRCKVSNLQQGWA
jgi:hypothetical protein